MTEQGTGLPKTEPDAGKIATVEHALQSNGKSDLPKKEHEQASKPLNGKKRREQNIGECTGTVVSVQPDKGYGFVRTIDGKAHFFHKSKFIDGAFPTFPDQGDGLKFDLEASPTKPDRTQCYNISRHEHSEEGIAPNTGHEQGIDTFKTEHEQEIEKLKATIESQSAIINANVVKHAEECEAVNNENYPDIEAIKKTATSWFILKTWKLFQVAEKTRKIIESNWSGKYDRLKVEHSQEVEKLKATIGKEDVESKLVKDKAENRSLQTKIENLYLQIDRIKKERQELISKNKDRKRAR